MSMAPRNIPPVKQRIRNLDIVVAPAVRGRSWPNGHRPHRGPPR
jgi:hypothetical protein